MSLSWSIAIGVLLGRWWLIEGDDGRRRCRNLAAGSAGARSAVQPAASAAAAETGRGGVGAVGVAGPAPGAGDPEVGVGAEQPRAALRRPDAAEQARRPGAARRRPRWPPRAARGTAAGRPRRRGRRPPARPAGGRRPPPPARRRPAGWRRRGTTRSSTTRCAGAAGRARPRAVPRAGPRPAGRRGGAPSRGGRRRTARRRCSRCAGRPPARPRSGRAPRVVAGGERHERALEDRPLHRPEVAGAAQHRLELGHDGRQLVDESEVGAGGLHRVEAARAGPLVLGRAAGRQAPAGQVTGSGEVQLRAAEHRQPAQDVGLHPAVTERAGQPQALGQGRLAVGRRAAEGDRHVAGELAEHDHLQPPVAPAAGGVPGRGEVVERRGEPGGRVVRPPPHDQGPTGELGVLQLGGEGRRPGREQDRVAGHEPRQRRLRRVQPGARRPRPVPIASACRATASGSAESRSAARVCQASRVGDGVAASSASRTTSCANS